MSDSNVIPFPKHDWEVEALRKMLQTMLPFMDWDDPVQSYMMRDCPLCKGAGRVMDNQNGHAPDRPVR